MKRLYLTAARFALRQRCPVSAHRMLCKALSHANRDNCNRSKAHIMRALNHTATAIKQGG